MLKQLENDVILDIETLIKIAELFKHKTKIPISKIYNCANIIIINDGKYTIDHTTSFLDKKKFKELINEFTYVFTTNYDEILDGVYDKEVYHLHGGIGYKKEVSNNAQFIQKDSKGVQNMNQLLILGESSQKKKNS